MLFQQILMKKATYETQNFSVFYFHFINYHCIADGCFYLLLSDKISSKRKTFIATLGHK